MRNVLVRGRYEPVDVKPQAPAETLVADLAAGRLTADELLQRYCSMVSAETHNLEETARRLNLDAERQKPGSCRRPTTPRRPNLGVSRRVAASGMVEGGQVMCAPDMHDTGTLGYARGWAWS
jgi:hypothetical protein